jgi:Xaa-Pro aminopeptidase
MAKFIFASTRDSDMRYAVKVNIPSSFFYLEKGKKKYVFLNRLDFGIFSFRRPNFFQIPLESLAQEAQKLTFETSDRNKIAYLILKKYRLLDKKVEISTHFPLDMADFLRNHGAKLTPTFPLFPERAQKTKEEIRFIQESLNQTKKAFRLIEDILRRSRIKNSRIYFQNKILTSEFLKEVVEKALFEKGMLAPLGMIISSGAQTAIPHHPGRGPILPHRPIICDIFPRHRKTGYFADMTRTYVKGKASPEIEKIYAAVVKTQKEVMKRIRPGISAQEIQALASEIVLKEGYSVGEEGLIHGLGHGIGLDIHEKPSLKLLAEDVLEEGNVITVEPGLYYPQVGGVRIEDVVLVTKTGNKNLTNYPKKLVIP